MGTASERWIVNDDPDNVCFGCSPHNPRGLQLRFRRRDGVVEAPWVAAEHHAGASGVIHGGVQATVLDEVMGMAAHEDGGDPALNVVTAEFHLRYRRPAPVGAPLLVRGRLLRIAGEDLYLSGEIVDAGGEVLTRAEARWRRIAGGR